MPPQAPDEELVARVVTARDRAAFGELVRRHQAKVRGWLRQLTRDPATADDLAQETFIRAWDRMATFTGQGRFAAWLMKIAYTEFLMARRQRQSEQRLTAALTTEQESEPPHDPTAAHAAATDVTRMLGVLDEDERIAMLLCYAAGFSHGEASEVTGMPLGTVKSHISRGKQKIRRRFFPEDDDHA